MSGGNLSFRTRHRLGHDEGKKKILEWNYLTTSAHDSALESQLIQLHKGPNNSLLRLYGDPIGDVESHST